LSEEATCRGKEEGVRCRREEGVCRRKAFAAGGRRPFIDLRIGPLAVSCRRGGKEEQRNFRSESKFNMSSDVGVSMDLEQIVTCSLACCCSFTSSMCGKEDKGNTGDNDSDDDD